MPGAVPLWFGTAMAPLGIYICFKFASVSSKFNFDKISFDLLKLSSSLCKDTYVNVN